MTNGLQKHENTGNKLVSAGLGLLLLGLLLFAGSVFASSEDTASAYGQDTTDAADTNRELSHEVIDLLPPEELGELVAPIALYPDDLLAIVLPASTYPLQIVQAARFLEARESNSNLKPDENWDESIVALLNYPEVVTLLNKDLDWTWKLGSAVIAQESEVLAAVSGFRERARIAGNLESDEHQTVAIDDEGVIEIRAADPEVIYVPYYEPARVTVYQRYPVYHYYPRPYPVYYYPYPADYAFSSGFFWGVTSAFSIGWNTHRLHLYHYGYNGHPYSGRRYHASHYYRRAPLGLGHDYGRHDYRYRGRGHAGQHERNHWRPNRHYAGVRPGDRQHGDNRHRNHRDGDDRTRDRGGHRNQEVRENHRSDHEEPHRWRQQIAADTDSHSRTTRPAVRQGARLKPQINNRNSRIRARREASPTRRHIADGGNSGRRNSVERRHSREERPARRTASHRQSRLARIEPQHTRPASIRRPPPSRVQNQEPSRVQTQRSLRRHAQRPAHRPSQRAVQTTARMSNQTSPSEVRPQRQRESSRAVASNEGRPQPRNSRWGHTNRRLNRR